MRHDVHSPSPYRARSRRRYSLRSSSRSRSPYQGRYRGRYRSSSRMRSQSPGPYSRRSPRGYSGRGRSPSRPYEYHYRVRSPSRQRGRSRYPDYDLDFSQRRPYSINRHDHRERREEREPSPLYYMRGDDGSTRVFKEVTPLFDANLNLRTVDQGGRARSRGELEAERRSIPIKREGESDNTLRDGLASNHWPPEKQPKSWKNRYPGKKMQALLLNGRKPRSVKQKRFLQRYRRENFQMNSWSAEDDYELAETHIDQDNPAFESNSLPNPTYPGDDTFYHHRANQGYPQQRYGYYRDLHPSYTYTGGSRYWPNEELYDLHQQSTRERFQTFRRRDMQDMTLQPRRPSIPREPMVREFYVPHEWR